ncbi:MAG: hypothetical protein H6736_22690 [Alphaproteobacteria bacterium]|nr:hypothetical protein [Alphaproteobacteria bacterium]MCB9694628.1 hypothetical protein [Alphaproteobacteria bacterium]
MHSHLADYRPPPGFVPTDSTQPDVTLFRPEDAGPGAMETRTRCPGCGASLTWDPGAREMACAYCGARVQAREGEDHGPGEFTREAVARGAQGWGADRPELRCDGCGAVLTIGREELSSTCPLCASNQVHVHEATSSALQPGYVLPFTVPADVAATTAREWLGKGWLRPSGVQDAAIRSFTGVYVPLWIFRADMAADYQVQVGTDVTETVRNSDGSTTTRRTTHWRWESGHLDYPGCVVSVPATAHVQGIEAVGPFPFGELAPYTPDVLVGFSAHGYDIGLPEGWEEGRDRLRNIMQSACCAQHRGDHYRSFSATVDLDDESWRYALVPVWTSAYRWGDRTWVVVVNGATGKIEGTRPVVWARVYLAIAAMLLPGLFTGVCLGLPGLALAGVGVFFLILAFIFLIFGIIGSVMVYSHATDEENL